MAKDRSFATKVAKAKGAFGKHCPQCGEIISYVQLITSEQSKTTSAWKFRQRFVKVCKCNQKDILG